MSTKNSTAHDRLAELDAAVSRAQDRFAATARKAREELADLPGLGAAEGNAWGRGDEAEAERIRKRREALEAAAATWRTRIAGTQRAVDQANRDRAEFVAGHGEQLVAERRGEAEAVAERLRTALAELVDAARGFDLEAAGQASYVRLTHRQRDHGLGPLALEAERALGRGVPDAAPGTHGADRRGGDRVRACERPAQRGGSIIQRATCARRRLRPAGLSPHTSP